MNEHEIFNAVRIETHPDHIAVCCVEGGEVDTALDGVTGKVEFAFDNNEPRNITTAGSDAFKPTYRIGDNLIFEFGGFLKRTVPRGYAGMLCVAEITQRLHEIGRSALVVASTKILATTTQQHNLYGVAMIPAGQISVRVFGTRSDSTVVCNIQHDQHSMSNFVSRVVIDKDHFTVHVQNKSTEDMKINWVCFNPS